MDLGAGVTSPNSNEVTKRSKVGVPPLKGAMVHGPLVLARQIHLGVILFGFLPLCNTAVRPSRLSTQ